MDADAKGLDIIGWGKLVGEEIGKGGTVVLVKVCRVGEGCVGLEECRKGLIS